MTRTRNLLVWLAVVLLAVATAAYTLSPGRAAAQEQPQATDEGLLEYELNTIEIVERYGNSVVSILVEVAGQRIDPFEGIPEDRIPPFFRFFGQPQDTPPRQGSGSGFVIDDDGRIIGCRMLARPV